MYKANNSKTTEVHRVAQTILGLSSRSLAIMITSFVIVSTLFLFKPITAAAVPVSVTYGNLVISFYNDDTTFPRNTVSQGELSACVDGQGVSPIERNSTKSMSAVDADNDGVYNVKVYWLVVSSANGSVIDPCSLGNNYVFWSGTVTKPTDQTKGYVIKLSGSDTTPVVTQGEVTNLADSMITSEWSNWRTNGQGLSSISMQEFNGTLYQAVRGTDDNIYTRASTNGFDWSVWVPNGKTYNEITMEAFFGKLYQAVRGTDGAIYTRNTTNGTVWSNWIANGATPGTVTMARNGAQLVQAVRGTDNNIYTRTLPSDSDADWSNWVAGGQTLNNVAMKSYNNAVYQSVVGTDKVIYLRNNLTPYDPATWSTWTPVKDTNNNPLKTASTTVELSISNNKLIVATTDAQSRSVLARLLSPLVNTTSETTIDINSTAKFNSISTIDKYYSGGSQSYIGNLNIQTTVSLGNGNISYRTAYGSNNEVSNWSAPSINGATFYQPSNFVYKGTLIQSVIGTDGNIYTRSYGYGAG